MLTDAHEYHRFFQEAKQTLAMIQVALISIPLLRNVSLCVLILLSFVLDFTECSVMFLQEKESHLGEDLGRDQQGVYALQRYHRAFEADLQPLRNQVRLNTYRNGILCRDNY